MYRDMVSMLSCTDNTRLYLDLSERVLAGEFELEASGIAT